MRKYRNVPTVVDGFRFDSKREAARYRELRMLEQAGAIEGLRLQPSFPLTVNDQKIGTYRADFEYVELITDPIKDWLLVVEDVKGMKTPVYNLKKKLMKALYGVEIRET